EDGIRDFHVTGVQTCALPICHRLFGNGLRGGLVAVPGTRVHAPGGVGRQHRREVALDTDEITDRVVVLQAGQARQLRGLRDTIRSEERRVGEYAMVRATRALE